MARLFFLIIYLISILTLNAKQSVFVKKDLVSEWQIFNGYSYQPFSSLTDKQHRIIHISLTPDLYKGDYLSVENNIPFSLFINNKLIIGNTSMLSISIDSIRNLVEFEPILISVYGSESSITESLRTLIITRLPDYTEVESGPIPRPYNEFKNFAIAAALILMIFFAFILRLNPKQTLDYFSIVRLFSLRESDDNQTFVRITSSANLLVYVFASLLIGFVIILLVHGLTLSIAITFMDQASDFVNGILLWLKVSVIILMLLFSKALVVTFFSILFGVSDQSGFQFLNFMRFILVLMVLLAASGTFYFILQDEGGRFHLFLFNGIKWIMFGWPILAIIKLLRRVHFSLFHLFSYICATEIIPFLIIIKFLYD